MVVLLTGFEPFADIAVNPSQLIVERLDGMTIGSASVVGRVLPVVFGEDSALVEALVAQHGPAVVLSLGVVAGEDSLRLESTARNLRRSPDGLLPIVEGAPEVYLASIPLLQVVEALQRSDVPVRVSNDAGDYLCNHVMYTTLHLAHQKGYSFCSGFVHVPKAAEHSAVGEPCLPLDMIEAGIRAAIAAMEVYAEM